MVWYTYTDVVKGREPSLRLGLARNRYGSGWFSVKQWYWYGNGTIFCASNRVDLNGRFSFAKLQSPDCTRPVSHGSVLKGSVFQSQWVWHSSLPFGPCLPFPGPQDSSSGSLSQILRMAKGRCFSHGFLVLWASLKTQPRCEWWVQNHTGHGRRHPVAGNPLQPHNHNCAKRCWFFPHLSGEDKAGKDCPMFAILTWREKKSRSKTHDCYIFSHFFIFFSQNLIYCCRWEVVGARS